MVKLKGNKRNSKGWRLLKTAKDETNGITLIALAITIVLNCSYLAMERMLKKEKILKSTK